MMKEQFKNENGVIFVEASIVFPLMFFVIFFLFFMGNSFYMRSQVEELAYEAAIKGAAYYADPLLQEMQNQEEVSIPKKIDDVKPYHYIFTDEEPSRKIRDELKNRINELGGGFFAGMDANLSGTPKAEFENHILYSEFVVELDYKITFPIRFMGSDEPTVLDISTRAAAPVTDTGEFIYNIDMILDYSDRFGVSDFISKMVEKVNGALSIFK